MNVDLLRAMSESPRWRNLRVGAYVDEFDAETTKQFSACVFELGNGTLYVAFRGTDSSIVGWKEDFMMAFRRPVASQEAAACYLTELADHWAGPIMVGGHSKGGNLAVYAAANVPSEIQERVSNCAVHLKFHWPCCEYGPLPIHHCAVSSSRHAASTAPETVGTGR